MATRYAAQRTIHATPETIWSLLTDASGYPAWNPTVISVEGSIAQDQRIALTSTVNPKRKFRLKVSEFEAPRRMVWSSGMPLGLFKGARTYTLTPQGDGATEFSMEEVFSGPMEPMISKSIPDMSESFEQFAEGLKTAAEADASGGSVSAP